MAPLADKILITGVSGFIGFKTLKTALERGYNVRAVVRQQHAAADLEAKSDIVADGSRNGKLEWAIVADFLAHGAIRKTLDGITVIVHLASPLAIETDNFDKDIVRPAASMLMTVLEAAADIETVRRVVITSSCVTLIPFEWNFAPDSEKLYSPSDINSSPSRPFKSSMEAYWASKAYARIATKTFIQERKPRFDIVNLLPSVVIGPDERLSSTTSSSDLLQGARGAVMGPLLGPEIVSAFPYVGTPVNVADVARAHIDAIEQSRVPGNTDYILSSNTPDGVNWDRDGREVAKKFFPSSIENGGLPLQGSLPSIQWRLDATQTQKAFGWRFTSFESTMRDLVAQYLLLKANEKV